MTFQRDKDFDSIKYLIINEFVFTSLSDKNFLPHSAQGMVSVGASTGASTSSSTCASTADSAKQIN